MRRLTLFATTIVLALAAAAPAGAVPRHIHSVTTPAGTTEFGAGVSTNAPCVAFLNLHFNVHLGAFTQGNPNTVSVQVIGPDCPA